MDPGLYKDRGVFGKTPEISKGDAGLLLDHLGRNHSSLIVGVKFSGGKPAWWKIKNSYGADGAGGGYISMSDSYLDYFVYDMVLVKAL